MPLDYRRFNGPEKSVSYKIYTKEYKKSKEELYKDLFGENGLRLDGRSFEEARTLSRFFAKTEPVSHAKGSSYLELNRTKVVCSVFEPRNIPNQTDYKQLGELYVEFKFAPFSCPRKRRGYSMDEEEKALSASLKKALEPVVCRQTFPNLQMDVYVMVMENDGGCLAAAINAAGLAIADAVIPMFDIITASSVAVINDQIFVDPTEAEEYLAELTINDETNHGVVTMSMLHELKQIADIQQVGAMDVNCITNIMEILEKECIKIAPFVQSLLVKSVVKNCENKAEEDKERQESEDALFARLEEMKSELKH